MATTVVNLAVTPLSLDGMEDIIDLARLTTEALKVGDIVMIRVDARFSERKVTKADNSEAITVTNHQDIKAKPTTLHRSLVFPVAEIDTIHKEERQRMDEQLEKTGRIRTRLCTGTRRLPFCLLRRCGETRQKRTSSH